MALRWHGLFFGSSFKGLNVLAQRVHKGLLSEVGKDVWMEFEWGLGCPHNGV